MTSSTVTFIWKHTHQASFDKLKSALVEDVLLVHPHLHEPFILHTDASSTATGAVLSQKHNGSLLPVAFTSRRFSPAE
jgi:hypothetical protein